MKTRIYKRIIRIMYSCIRFMISKLDKTNCGSFRQKRINIVKDKGLFKGNRCNIISCKECDANGLLLGENSYNELMEII